MAVPKPLTKQQVAGLRAPLKRAQARFAKLYPGEAQGRQPVHTVYGGAQLFRHDTARKLGDLALQTLEVYAPDAGALARALDLQEGALPRAVYSRVVEKLRREPVEDLRIDFEDGYGHRSDEEEDGHALCAAAEVAKGMAQKTLPPSIGIRVKPLGEELFARSARTLELFVGALVEQASGKLPEGFVVTLPKVTLPEEVQAACRLLGLLERRQKLGAGALKLELMVELPQAIFDAQGRVPLPALVRAAGGRCVGAHFGSYDYTAGVNVTAAHQSMDHPACDFAKQVMQASLAGTGVRLSDGATNRMPVGPHRAKPGEVLGRAQLEANREVVHQAWRTSYRHIRHSLVQGFYQGWDLHPAQLPVRYAAVYAFFLEGMEAASARLRGFMDEAARATVLGGVFDDAASGQGLLNYFLQGQSCGALTPREAQSSGLTSEELRSRSFRKILEGRSPPGAVPRKR